jgi:predicted RNA-binding protein with PUA-like domain
VAFLGKECTGAGLATIRHQARNLSRDEVKAGGGVLFYRCNVSEPSVPGLARVVREGYPDFTALDPLTDHFDPRATGENPIWYMDDVRYFAPLKRPLGRRELSPNPHLAKMMLLKKAFGCRFSPSVNGSGGPCLT